MIDTQAGLQPVSARGLLVGADLRAARERLQWTLDDTAGFLRIRPKLLRSLEDGRSADLPGLVYAIGFVRSYALALGLDPDEMVGRYRQEIGAAELQSELDFPAPLPQRHVPVGAVVVLGTVLAIAGYVGWYRTSADHVGTVPIEQVPPRLAPLALAVVPPPAARNAPVMAPSAVAGVYLPPSVSPTAAEASMPAPGSLTPIEPAPVAAGRLVLGAIGDAWVQVKDPAGKVVLAKLMHAGESWAVPDKARDVAPLVLTTGNAGGTVLTLDGQALPPLGGSGEVRRGVVLDPSTLRAPATHQ